MNNDVMTILFMLAIFVFFYATIVMPQRKREKKIRELQNSLKVGDDIITFAGIIGKIIHISDSDITIESGAEKTKINITKWSVKEVINASK